MGSKLVEDGRLRTCYSLRAGLLLLSIASLLAVMVGTTGTTSAQGARLQVTLAKPLQVVEDVPLVVGKATALRVDITASAATRARVEVSLAGRARAVTASLRRGANTLYVPVDPPAAPGVVPYSARVTNTAGAGGNRIDGQAQVVALQRNWMKILFMPVDWSDQDRARYFASHYNQFLGSSSDFFRATYPVPENNVQIGSSPSMYMLTPEQRAISDGQGNLNWDAITSMYSSVAIAGRRVMPDADLVVGVLPPKWFARNLNEPNTVGLELHTVRAVVSTQVDSDYATLAHEAGHVFNLTDEYDFSVNPPRIGNRIDVPGYWIAKSTQIRPGGTPVYYSFMGASDRGSQYWVDRNTYLAILQTLQSGAFQP
jgi:hypothetical protein